MWQAGVVNHAEVASPTSLHSATSGMSGAGSDWGGMVGAGSPSIVSPVPTSPDTQVRNIGSTLLLSAIYVAWGCRLM